MLVVDPAQAAAHRLHLQRDPVGQPCPLHRVHAAQKHLIDGPVVALTVLLDVRPDAEQRERGPDAGGRAFDPVPRDALPYHLRKLFRRPGHLAEIDVELPCQKFKFRFRERCEAPGGTRDPLDGRQHLRCCTSGGKRKPMPEQEPWRDVGKPLCKLPDGGACRAEARVFRQRRRKQRSKAQIAKPNHLQLP